MIQTLAAPYIRRVALADRAITSARPGRSIRNRRRGWRRLRDARTPAAVCMTAAATQQLHRGGWSGVRLDVQRGVRHGVLCGITTNAGDCERAVGDAEGDDTRGEAQDGRQRRLTSDDHGSWLPFARCVYGSMVPVSGHNVH